jgi:Flp pilus assembly protein TadD
MAYKLRGGVLGRMGRRDEAIADFRKALELDPSDESVKKNLKDLGVTP